MHTLLSEKSGKKSTRKKESFSNNLNKCQNLHDECYNLPNTGHLYAPHLFSQSSVCSENSHWFTLVRDFRM